MKLIAIIILSVILVLLGMQIYSFSGRYGRVRQDFLELQAKLDKAKTNNNKFQAELNYYLNPVNLEKELRARFNYKSPDEKLIIIIPKNQSSTRQ